jgi:hypothetical protein
MIIKTDHLCIAVTFLKQKNLSSIELITPCILSQSVDLMAYLSDQSKNSNFSFSKKKCLYGNEA